MTSYTVDKLSGRPQRKAKADIKEALKNNGRYVYASDKHFEFWRIINVRIHKELVEGKALASGKWFVIYNWEQR